MTKSNKTLLCCLLTCVMVLACALTILPIATPTTANAAETVVATFTMGDDGDAKHVDSSSKASTYTETSGDIKLTLTSLTNVYPKSTDANGNGCLKLGANGKAASFSFTVGEEITKVRIYVAGYKDKTASISINDGDMQDITTTSNSGEYTAIEVDTSSNKTVKFSSKERCMVNTIEFLADVEEKSIVPTINGTTIENASTVVSIDGKCDVYLAATNGYAVGKTYAIVLNNFVDKSTAFSVIVNGGEPAILENDGTKEQMTINGTFVEEGLNVVVSEYVVVACDHTELTLVPEVAATCTATGVKAHYKCANVACGKLFDKNTADKQEVTFASLTIAALDHQWNDGEITTAATCTTDGVKTFTCTREGCGETKTETIPALGHNYGTDGKCTLCGAEKPAEKVYKLVTDVAQLKSGSKVIFVGKNGGNYVMANQRTNNWGATAVTIDNQSITMEEGTAYTEFLLTTNGMTYEISYTSGEKTMYIYAPTSDDNNYLRSQATNDENGKWLITIESGNAELKSSGNNRYLRYNSSSKLFSSYKSGQNPVSIYMLEEPEAEKQFTVTETVTAVENGSILNNGTMYILPNGQIDVVYNVTANSGINALEGTIAWNAELFDFVSMTAGNIFGENNVTVSGESATTKKIAVTIGASNNATGVLLTVRYQLKAGVTAEQLANAKFGFTVDVLFGTDTTTKVANTATENEVPMSVRQDATLTVNGVDCTADDRTITLTYNGQDITAGTEEDSVLKIATNHTGYNADCLTWTVVKNAGNYVLKIAVAADGAYNAISEVSYTIVVKQVEIASTNIAITNNTTSKDLLGGNAKWTEADFTITYNGETLPDEFSGLYQIAITDGEVAEAVAQHTLTVELTLTAQASVNYVLTGTDVAEGKLSKQFVVSVVNAAINIIGMPDNVERAYNAQAIALSDVSVEEGATLKIYVALNGGTEVEVTENLDTYVKNVGDYVVRFEAHKNANVYSQTRTYTITKCDLAKVELVYNVDTVTWTDTQTNGETVVVKYTIAATEITNHAYTATQKNTEEVKLVVSTDNANYNGYELALANVYAVTFADDKHETTTQYRFANQLATSITPAAVGGFAFDGWYVTEGETESKYEFTTKVTADVNLTAKWTALTFTVTLVNGTETQKFENVAYETPLDTLGITDASKADDEDNYYTFVGWTLTAEGEVIDLATTKVTDNMTLYAKFTSASNKFTLTWTLTYNGNAVENGTLTVKRNTALENIVGLPTSKNANVLRIGTWKNGENEFTAMPTANVEITAAYEIALQAGDVNGDGKVNLDDVVLFRKYLVGGYAMDVVADENIYTAITAADAASKTMFFKYSANMDNDANLDIRDVATIRMNVVATTEGGEEQTQTTQSAARMEVVSEAVQYAVLPTNKFVA